MLPAPEKCRTRIAVQWRREGRRWPGGNLAAGPVFTKR